MDALLEFWELNYFNDSVSCQHKRFDSEEEALKAWDEMGQDNHLVLHSLEHVRVIKGDI